MADPAETAERAPRERRNRDPEMMRAALALFSSKGYSAASVQDVADAIGVLKGSVYHYIESKEDLLFRIFDDAHAENEAIMVEITALDVGAVEKLRTYLERSLLVTLNNIERTTLYFRDWRYLTGTRLETITKHRRQYDIFLRELIAEAYAQKVSLRTFNSSTSRRSSSGAPTGSLTGSNQTAPYPAESIAADYSDMAMSAIFGSQVRTSR